MLTPTIGPKTVVYENKYQQIYRVKADFGSFAKEFFVNDYGKRVGIVVARGDELLLVRQYRLLVGELAWEIPGGRIDDGETPEEAAARECVEETCLQCRDVKPLLYYHPGLDTFDNPTFLFYATEFDPAPPEKLHRHEVQEQVWVPVSRCLEMIFEKKLVDCMSMTAILAYHVLKTRNHA